ncbi:MAG: tetratricopeptide repeat protein [Spirochaetota bacterium]
MALFGIPGSPRARRPVIAVLLTVVLTASLGSLPTGDLQSAIVAVQQGDYVRADETLTELLKRGPDAQALFWRGVARAALGMVGDAVADVEESIEHGLNVPATHTVLAQLHAAAGDLARAEEILRDAAAQWPGDAQVSFSWGRVLDHLRRYEEAASAYSAAIRNGYPGGEAYRRRADSYAAAGERELAQDDYASAIELEPQNATFYQARGHFVGRRDFRRALADYQRAAALAPNWALPHNNAGYVLNELERHDEALPYLQRAVDLDPEWSLPRNNLAIALESTGDLEAAVASYREAIRLDPDYGNAHSNLARLLMEDEATLEEADFHSREALRVNPEAPMYMNMRGLVLEKLGDYGAAIERFQAARAADYRFVYAHRNLGRLYYHTGLLEEARSSMETALGLGERDYAIRSRLARILAAGGAYERALQELERLRSPNLQEQMLIEWLESLPTGGRRSWSETDADAVFPDVEVAVRVISTPPGTQSAHVDHGDREVLLHSETLFYVFDVSAGYPNAPSRDVSQELGGAFVTDLFGDLWRIQVAQWDRSPDFRFGGGLQHFWSSKASVNGSALACSSVWMRVYLVEDRIVGQEVPIPLPGEREPRRFAILYDDSYDGPVGPYHVPALARPTISSADYLGENDELVVTFRVADERAAFVNVTLSGSDGIVAEIEPTVFAAGLLSEFLNDGAPLRTDGTINTLRIRGSLLASLDLLRQSENGTSFELRDVESVRVDSLDGGQFRHTDRWGEYIHESRGSRFPL